MALHEKSRMQQVLRVNSTLYKNIYIQVGKTRSSYLPAVSYWVFKNAFFFILDSIFFPTNDHVKFLYWKRTPMIKNKNNRKLCSLGSLGSRLLEEQTLASSYLLWGSCGSSRQARLGTQRNVPNPWANFLAFPV